MATLNLFGFKIGKDDSKSEILPSFSPPVLDDGAVTITASAHYGTSLDLETNYKNEIELITRYREMAMQPEVESAVDDIINEAIVQIDNSIVDLQLDALKISDKIKKAIEEEFNNVLTLLNFKNLGQDIFRRFYVDGRLYYNIILDPENVSSGIQELRYIDPRKLTKVREIKKSKDQATGADIVTGVEEYYVYAETVSTRPSNQQKGLKISPDSIINVTSGLMDSKRAIVLSYLHKCIKPLNMLRMIEDASIIYKVSRAPERRIFYVDVGNLPKMKAEQYLKDIMTKYKNKVVYDANSGQIRDDRKYLSMQEDFWLPRRNGESTEITTLPSSGAFDDMSMVEYFEKKLYKALNVPYSRLHQPETGFSIGRSQEISRDEIKFSKFINRLRSKFNDLFDQALKVQCICKGICTAEEFDNYKQSLVYDYKSDNNYSELMEAELITNRLSVLSLVDPYIGKYFSKKWVQTKVLNMSDDEIKQTESEIINDINNNIYVDPKLQVKADESQLESQLEPVDNTDMSTQDSLENATNNYQDIQDNLENAVNSNNNVANKPNSKTNNTNPYYNG